VAHREEMGIQSTGGGNKGGGRVHLEDLDVDIRIIVK
jgi:hypothetical protein